MTKITALYFSGPSSRVTKASSKALHRFGQARRDDDAIE